MIRCIVGGKMTDIVVHNPDQYMSDFRLLLSQGNKRIGVLIGAGASASIVVGGFSLVPMIAQLTSEVVNELSDEHKKTVENIVKDLEPQANIEAILSKLRLLARALGDQQIFGVSGAGFEKIAAAICELIGKRVNVKLPDGENPYSHLVNWITGTARRYGVEIFTTNYDLLTEEALERAHAPYFDGFSGGVSPFFDAATVSNDDLPPRWTRIWKLHGSLGWALVGGQVTRTQSRTATHLIYPDHLKYDHTQKQPYAALFDRLKNFLRTPDSLLITVGFSFADAHIVSAFEESLAANPLAAVLALQFKNLAQEKMAVALGEKRPNLSVYAADGAVINGTSGLWKVGPAPNDMWLQIRRTFWGQRDGAGPEILKLGCFKELSRFVALAGNQSLRPAETTASSEPAPSKSNNPTPEPPTVAS
jgi:SIR2-like domain